MQWHYIYAIRLQPLVKCLNKQEVKQVWFADDSAAGGKLCGLLQWWQQLVAEGPKFGYHRNFDKTWVVVKDGIYAEAVDKFSGTGIEISKEGREYLGSAIGGQEFTSDLVRAKVNAWANEVKQLSNYATSQPHAAYSDFTHGLSSKWKYLMQTTNTDCSFSHPLVNAIICHFLPGIIGKGAFSDTECTLLA